MKQPSQRIKLQITRDMNRQMLKYQVPEKIMPELFVFVVETIYFSGLFLMEGDCFVIK